MATAILAKGSDIERGKIPTPLTYEEFLRVYDGEFAEWEDGKIVQHMSPVSFNHTNIGLFLTRLLSDFCENNNSGQVVYAPYQMRLRQFNRGCEPDVAVVLTANLSRITPGYLDGPADFVVEIVSPESETRDRETKFAEYEFCGVTEYWIVDPVAQTAEFYVRNPVTLKYVAQIPDANGNYESTVLPGFWLTVAWLWQTPLPTLRSVIAAWSSGKP